MSRFTPLLIVAALHAGPLAAQQAPEAEIAAMMQRYKEAFAKQEAAETNASAPAKAEYIRNLERLRDSAKQAAQLEGVLDAEAVLKSLQEGSTPPPPKVLGPQLAKAQSMYERSRDEAIKFIGPARERLETDYTRTMSELEQKYTRAGNVAAAKDLRTARLEADFHLSNDILPKMKGGEPGQDGFVLVKGDPPFDSPEKYSPPIEIEYVFKTDQQIRFGYAANQIILNWEVNPSELRVDGGPVGGQHRPMAGEIPKNELVDVRQIVHAKEMMIYVNGEQRAHWVADFSRVNGPIKLRAPGSTVSLKHINIYKTR